MIQKSFYLFLHMSQPNEVSEADEMACLNYIVQREDEVAYNC